jgi:hypothetical protein
VNYGVRTVATAIGVEQLERFVAARREHHGE